MHQKNVLAVQWKSNKTLFPYSPYSGCSESVSKPPPSLLQGRFGSTFTRKNLNAAAVTDIGLSGKIRPEHRYVKVVCLSLYCISFLYSWIASIIRCCYSGCSIRVFCMGLFSICCLAVLWFVTAEVTAGCMGWALSVPLWSQHTPENVSGNLFILYLPVNVPNSSAFPSSTGRYFAQEHWRAQGNNWSNLFWVF